MIEQEEQTKQIPLGGEFSRDTQSFQALDSVVDLNNVQRGIVSALREDRKKLREAAGQEVQRLQVDILRLEKLAEEKGVPRSLCGEPTRRPPKRGPRDWGAHLSDPDYHRDRKEK